jgi:UDP-N-acetyl-D-galactosamine dehydrogenase
MNEKICVVGLGYVGLPLAVAFGKVLPTIGFDISERRVKALSAGHDATGEVSDEELAAARHLSCTSDPKAISDADIVIVAVPTPVDKAHRPDLSPLFSACRTVGPNMKEGAIVVFESTVYPGATEGDCVPVLEEFSSKKCGRDFFVGYSPERINPGDKNHTLSSIVKVVAGQTPEITDRLAKLYEMVVSAGVHKASSIRVAEAAKVIENTQRDLNIALVNELSILFHRLGIDTKEVLEAAGTKWNFLPFKPGLVGGHCIGVDPYYLTHKAEEVGYHPQVVLAGRRINDGMASFVAAEAIKGLISLNKKVNGGRALVLGFTFKANIPDIRNSKVADLVKELTSFGLIVDIHDPHAEPEEAQHEYGLSLLSNLPETGGYDLIVYAVNHAAYIDIGVEELKRFGNEATMLVDLPRRFKPSEIEAVGLRYWGL